MIRIGLLSCLVGFACSSALAQGVQFGTDPKAAVASAKKQRKPMMVYVLAGSKNRDNDTERDQQRVLNDARVIELAKKFVPLRLSRSADRDVLKQMKIPDSANLDIFFVSPEGDVIADLSGSGLTKVDSTLEKMHMVLKNYRLRVFKADCEKPLDDPESKPEAIRAALKIIKELEISESDATLVKLLERDEKKRVEADIAKEAIELLATFSTRAAVDKLVALAITDDKNEYKKLAVAALGKCTPPAAEQMYSKLDAAAKDFPYEVYAAICKICGIRDVKPERYFEGNERLKKEEIKRLEKLVKDAAKKWLERNENR